MPARPRRGWPVRAALFALWCGPLGVRIERTIDPSRARALPLHSAPAFCWRIGRVRPVMPVIAIVNRKGGSGKSTLAAHLAAYYASSGVAVMLGDVDRQQSTQSWLRLRGMQPLRRGVPIVGWAVDPKRVLRPPAGVSLVVLDTPGGLHGFDLARVVAFADVILMPVCNSAFDRESAADCHAELMALPRVASGRCKVAAVGMRLDARTKAGEVLAGMGARPQAAFHRRAARGAGLCALDRAGPDLVRPARRAGAGRPGAMEDDRRVARAGAAHRASTHPASQPGGRAAGVAAAEFRDDQRVAAGAVVDEATSMRSRPSPRRRVRAAGCQGGERSSSGRACASGRRRRCRRTAVGLGLFSWLTSPRFLHRNS